MNRAAVGTSRSRRKGACGAIAAPSPSENGAMACGSRGPSGGAIETAPIARDKKMASGRRPFSCPADPRRLLHGVPDPLAHGARQHVEIGAHEERFALALAEIAGIGVDHWRHPD